MQMRERKYIRFDFTQALHTRATRAERRDYRIIARTRTVDHAYASALAYAVHFAAATHACARKAFVWRSTPVRSDLALPIYFERLRGSLLFKQKPFAARAERPIPAATMREATTSAAKSVSNGNDADAHRNRIFLRRHYQISVDETLQPPTSSSES
jgi:hypothetical protein